MSQPNLAARKKRWISATVVGAIIAYGIFSVSFSAHIWGLPDWFWEYVAFPVMYVAGLMSMVSCVVSVKLDTKMKKES